jgi:hypothetical protein
VRADEIVTAKEAILVGSSLQVVAITQWNEAILNPRTGYDGRAGPVATYLNGLLEYDQVPRPSSRLHTPVPYGYLSGMREQLE